MARVLIAGGSGLIGTRLSKALKEAGYEISILSRQAREIPDAEVFVWDPAKATMDAGAVESADVVVNFAGAGIAEKRWSRQRKQVLYDSRIQSTRLLVDSINKSGAPKTLISASAIGYYGDSGGRMMTEDDTPGSNYLARICIDWEAEAKKLADPHRLVLLRIGVVFAKEGGALKEIRKSIKPGVASYLGDGKMYFSWIHVKDIVSMIQFAIEKPDMRGTFNAVSPETITAKQLVKQIVAAEGNRAILAPAPEFAIRLLLGEMASVVLETQRCSSDKIVAEGFAYDFPSVEGALADILG